MKLSRILSLRTVCSVAILAAILAALFLWWPPVRSSAGRFDRSRNAVWLEHAWLSASSTPAAGEALVRRMRARGIRTLYPHLCPMQRDGSLPADFSPEALKRLLTAARRAGPGETPLRVVPWVGGVHGKTVFLSDKQQAERFAAECARLTSEFDADGVQVNIEPLSSGDTRFLRLLEKIREAIGPEKILSVAAYPPPTRLHPSPMVHWDREMYREVAARADELAVMAYDTGVRTSPVYRRLVADWTVEALRWSAESGNGDVRVFIGIPSYGEESGYHHPRTENVRNAVAGVNLGLERLAASAGESDRRALALLAGLAVYRDRTTDALEWREWRWLWRGGPGPVAPRPGFLLFWLEIVVVLACAVGFFLLGRWVAALGFRGRLKGTRLERGPAYVAAILGSVLLFYRIATMITALGLEMPLPGALLPDILFSAVFLLVGARTKLLSPFEPAPAAPGALSGSRLGRILRGKVRRARPLLAVLVLLAGCVVVIDKGYLAVEGPRLARLRGEIRDGVVLQPNGFTCLPASGATALAVAGVETDVGEVSFHSRTTRRGTDPGRFAAAAIRIAAAQGIELEVRSGRFTLEELRRLGRPAVLETWISGMIPHATALIGFEGEKAILGEPLRGRVLASEEELKGERWLWGGSARVLIARKADGSTPPPVELVARAKSGLDGEIAPPLRWPTLLVILLLAFRHLGQALLTRKRTHGGERRARATTAALFLGYVAAAAVLVLDSEAGGVDFGPRLWAGLGLFAAAVLFRLWALVELGEFYSEFLDIREAHRLVTSGPYQLVRHPLHLAFLAEVIALAVIGGHPAMMLPALVVVLAAIILRNREEDRALREKFGDEFEAWAVRVPAVNLAAGIIRSRRREAKERSR